MEELKTFSEKLQADPEWAWVWHCNLAMMAYDAGAEHAPANIRAADFMSQAFGVDIRANPLWSTVMPNDTEPKITAGVLQAESQNTERLLHHKKVHKVNLGPHTSPGFCLDCGKPQSEWSSLSEECTDGAT